MGDFLSAVFKPLESKLRSPLYMAFIFAFVVWNWDVFVTLFFVSNESIITLTKLTKGQYIHDVIIWNKDWITHIYGISSWSFFLGYISIFIWRYLVPVGITYVVIRYLPYLGNWAHSEEKKFALMKDETNFIYRKDRLEKEELHLGGKKEEEKASLETEKLAMEVTETKKELEQRIQKLSSAEKALVDERVRIRKENNKTSNGNKMKKTEIVSEEINQSIALDKEYIELINKYSNIIQILKNFIYQAKGFVGHSHEHISVEHEMILDSNDLINKNKEKNIYELTEKGRFFLKKSSL